MDWLSASGAIFTALALVLLPGIAIGAVLGLRWFTVVAIAPLLTVTAIVLGTIATGFAHLRWNLIALIVTVAVLCVFAFIAHRILRRFNMVRRRTFGPRLSRWAFIGTAFAALVIGVRLAYIIGWPENISQAFDVVFHLNAVQYILDTGNANPFTLANFNLSGFGKPSFYPAAWHGLTAMVAMVSGASVPVAVSAVSIVTSAIIWPLGVVYLARTLFGARRLTLAVAGILAAAFAAFPYLTLDFGVLYAFGFALTLTPAFFALVIGALKLTSDGPVSRWMAIVILAAALPGLAVAHPTVLMFVVVLSIPAAITAVIRQRRIWKDAGAPRRNFAWMYAGLGLGLAASAAGYVVLRTGNYWEPQGKFITSLVKLALNAPDPFIGPAWALSGLIVLGLLAMILTPKLRWYLVCWAIFAVLFVIALGVGNVTIRNIFIGTWFGDPVRIAAMLAITALPVATYGFVWTLDYLRSHWLKKLFVWNARFMTALALIVLILATQISNVNKETAIASEHYKSGSLLTKDEVKLLKDIPSIVPAGDVIAGNPWTGTPLVYAISHREPLVNYMFHELPEYDIIGQHLQDALTDPAVCAYANAHRIHWVLDFGTQEVYIGHHVYKGYANLENSKVVTLVKQEGNAKLYRITACDAQGS